MTSPECPVAQALPPRVLQFVQRQLATLGVLTRARLTDERFNGRGRYEAEAYLNHQHAVDQAWKSLAEWEALCAQNSVEPQSIYAVHGTPPKLSQDAMVWLKEWGRSAAKPEEPLARGANASLLEAEHAAVLEDVPADALAPEGIPPR